MQLFLILPLGILDGAGSNDPDVREQQRDLIRQIDQAELRREGTLGDKRQMSRGRVREQAVITSANYEMKLIGKDSPGGTVCDVLELIPKRKSPYLLKERLWVDPAEMMPVKIEGKPPTSASFFSGRPQVVREYKQMNGFALAQRSHAVSSNFLFGQSTVDNEYCN